MQTRRGQLHWDPTGGGVLPGEARTAKGGEVGILHHDSPSLASEDFKWYVGTRTHPCGRECESVLESVPVQYKLLSPCITACEHIDHCVHMC